MKKERGREEMKREGERRRAEEREGEKCEGGEASAYLVTRSVNSGGSTARVTFLVGFFRYRCNSKRESRSG